MKQVLVIIWLIILQSHFAIGQQKQIDSVWTILEKEPKNWWPISATGHAYLQKGEVKEANEFFDGIIKEAISSNRNQARLYHGIGLAYEFMGWYDDAEDFYSMALEKAFVEKDTSEIINASVFLTTLYNIRYQFRRSVELLEQIRPLAGIFPHRTKDDSLTVSNFYLNLGVAHYELQEYNEAVTFIRKQKNFLGGDTFPLFRHQLYLGYSFIGINQADSAKKYMQAAVQTITLRGDPEHNRVGLAYSIHLAGEYYNLLKQRRRSIDHYRKAGQLGGQFKEWKYQYLKCLDSLAINYGRIGMPDSALYFARLLKAELYQLFNEQNDKRIEATKEVLQYSNNTAVLGARKVLSLQKILSDEQQRQRALELREIAFQNRMKQYSLLAGLGVFLLVALLLYRNNRQKQKSNKILEKTLTDLKATQSQLIQSEKLASLGELTAGIAHEIQNPLNFVNNFSEVSNELMDEMKTELNKNNKEDALAIADDVKQNLEKILYHGKRADAIVKGMLQHSKNSTGVKEPTNINALADEYFRLAYHGLRAKDKSFNATMNSKFDESIGNINIIPQDIGRVILNLITNAFYTVAEKKKQAGDSYEPTVSVSTIKSGNRVLISVKDNGNGIPQKVLQKIFQPFFTTKPTGQGTGLGLSLSYDIVKAHGGELKVETKEGVGSEFSIVLPC